MWGYTANLSQDKLSNAIQVLEGEEAHDYHKVQKQPIKHSSELLLPYCSAYVLPRKVLVSIILVKLEIACTDFSSFMNNLL